MHEGVASHAERFTKRYDRGERRIVQPLLETGDGSQGNPGFVGQLHRSFHLIDSSTVDFTINRKRARYTVAIGPAADIDGNPETIVALRSGHEVLYVTIAGDGSAMCHCHQHFDRNGCWHADLAMALVKHLESSSFSSACPQWPMRTDRSRQHASRGAVSLQGCRRSKRSS